MLRILHQKRRSCTLVVATTDGETHGSFYIKDGTIIAASQGNQDGHAAAMSMLTWNEPTITLYPLPTRTISNIAPSLAASLLQQQFLPTVMPRLSLAQPPQPVEQDGSSASVMHVDVFDGTLMSSPTTIPPAHVEIKQKEISMTVLDEVLKKLMEIDGAVGVAIVDWTSGMALGSLGNALNIELAAAGNSDVVRAKLRVINDLGLKDEIEDILITLHTQYHLIRIVASNPNLFIYFVLNRGGANLALARYRLSQVEKDFVV